MSGYVYILINASLPGLVKIGITSRDPFARAAELHTTGVPTAFTVVAALLVADPADTEAYLHRALDAERVDQGREFFRTPVQTAVGLLLAQAENLNAENGNGTLPSPARPDIDDSVQLALTHLQPGENFNLPLAEQLLTTAAKRGSALAHCHLGQLICDHHDLYKKPVLARAIKHFERAAAAGLPDAFFGLAWLKKPEYVSGYLSREPDPMRAQEKAIALFIRALFTERTFPDAYRTPYFIGLIPQIHTTFKNRTYKDAERSTSTTRYARFLEYARQASAADLCTFIPSESELDVMKKAGSNLSFWSFGFPTPSSIARYEMMEGFRIERESRETAASHPTLLPSS